MIQFAILAVIAFVVATLAPFFLYRLSQNPLPILYLFMASMVIDVWTVSPMSFRLGLNVYLFDICGMAALACFLLRLFQGNILSLFEPTALLLIVLTTSFVRGLTGYGTEAGVDYRLYVHALTAMLLFSTYSFTPDQLRLIRRAWIIMAAFVTAIVVYRWTVDLFGLPFERTWENAGAQNRIRVIGVDGALVIAMGGLAVLAGGTRGAGWRSVLLGNLFLLTVVVLQHRSVWVATLVGLAVLAVIARRARPVLLKQAIALAIAAPIALGIGIAAGMDTSVLTESIVESTETAVKGEGTVNARELSWQALLAGYNRAQMIDKVLGAPMGSGYLRFTGGIYDPRVQFSPHNFYLQVLLRGGILGAALLLVALGLAVARALRNARATGNAVSHWLAATVFMSLAFFIPYGGFVPAGLALGLAQARIRSGDLPAPRG